MFNKKILYILSGVYCLSAFSLEIPLDDATRQLYNIDSNKEASSRWTVTPNANKQQSTYTHIVTRTDSLKTNQPYDSYSLSNTTHVTFTTQQPIVSYYCIPTSENFSRVYYLVKNSPDVRITSVDMGAKTTTFEVVAAQADSTSQIFASINQAGQTLVTYNREPTSSSNAYSQAILIENDGTSSGLYNIFTEDDTSTVDKSCSPITKWNQVNNHWHIVQNVSTNKNLRGYSCTFDGSTVSNIASCPDIMGKKAHFLQVASTSSGVYASSNNSSSFDGNLSQSQLLQWSGSLFAPHGSSYDSRPAFERLQNNNDSLQTIYLDKDYNYWFTYVSNLNNIKITNKSSSFMKQLNEQPGCKLESLQHLGDVLLEGFLTGAAYQTLTKSNHITFASSSGANRSKKLHNVRGENYSTKIRVLSTTTQISDQQNYLVKKYASQTPTTSGSVVETSNKVISTISSVSPIYCKTYYAIHQLPSVNRAVLIELEKTIAPRDKLGL